MACKHTNNSPPCDTGFFERLNYYFGKLMTVRDFTAEQRYFNEKRWLLNRTTIGWGVVCGLDVKKNDQCPTQVCVSPGLALDQAGNEILVCRDQLVDVIPKELANREMSGTFYVCLKFAACYTEPAPVPIEECGDFSTDCQYNRVRETFQLEAIAEQGERYHEINAQIDASIPQNGNDQFDCIQFLENPCPTLTASCQLQGESGWLILAKVTVQNGVVLDHIDNCTYRKAILSNAHLQQATQCLNNELQKVYAARMDRRQFVPLLAQTIKGLKHRDGRKKVFSMSAEGNYDAGFNPFSITSDGDHIWATDIYEQSTEIVKIGRNTNAIEKVNVKHPSWGIAYDDVHHQVWVTHHLQSEDELLTRIDIHTPDQKNDFSIPAHPKEIVFDGNYMWITHEKSKKITKIDTRGIEAISEFDYSHIPLLLAYDGEHIWVVYKNGVGTLDGSIEIKGSWAYPESITFDGTCMWIMHENGASIFNVSDGSDQVIRTLQMGQNMIGSAFDGMCLWIAGKNTPRIYRIDIFHDISDEGEFQLRGVTKEHIQLQRMCFDGLFFWVTAYEEMGQNEKCGLIHRLLL